MSLLTGASGHLDRVVRASLQQRVLRGVAGVAAAGFPVLVGIAGGSAHPWGGAFLVLLAVGLVLMPDSGFPLAWMSAATLLWVASMPDALEASVLVAAGDLVVVHLACTIAAYGPPELTVPAGLVRLWLARAALMVSVTALLLLATRFFGVLDVPASTVVFSTGLCLVAAWALVLLPRLVTRDGAPDS
ncbi:MAG: hypothetical protein H0V42_11930 [Nocardioidaceae bacterium]|nr:hypothetical protein [Nocardioidaceae bacterium]